MYEKHNYECPAYNYVTQFLYMIAHFENCVTRMNRDLWNQNESFFKNSMDAG